MPPEFDDDPEPLGRSQAFHRDSAPDAHTASEDATTPPAPPAPAEQAEPGRLREPVTCLIVGPPEAGKTAFLAALPQACAADSESDIFLNLSWEAKTVDRLKPKGKAGEGRNATNTTEKYRFEMHPIRDGETESFTDVNFTFLDGPGGALFRDKEHNDRVGLSGDDIETHKNLLIEEGKKSTSIVIFINPTHPKGLKPVLLGNLSDVLSEMKVKRRLPASSETRSRDRKDGFFARFRRRQAEPLTAAPTEFIETERMTADRIVIVLNFFDQICLRTQQQWQDNGIELGNSTPHEIAVRYARPIEFGKKIMGTSFFRDLHGSLKPNAKIAVALCSSGGFDQDTGDPYLSPKGEANLLPGIDPDLRLSRVNYFGVRETIMYAGLGIPTPGIVEEISIGELTAPKKKEGK